MQEQAVNGEERHHLTTQECESDPTHPCKEVCDLDCARGTIFSTTKIHVECFLLGQSTVIICEIKVLTDELCNSYLNMKHIS